MPRNAEVIRQWTILREIENARGSGVTIHELATLCGVTTRTIRRDLQALEESGFPLFDDRSRDDGRTRWNINGQALKGLSAGLTLSELCALYFSRTLVEALSGTPFREDVERAFDKLAAGLTPHMRQFLDQLPHVIAAKPDAMHGRPVDEAADSRRQQVIARALEASLHRRQATITYHSRSSQRTKPYLVHPYRLAHALGGYPALAYVPGVPGNPNFAVERIQEDLAAGGPVHAGRRAARHRVSRFARRALGAARARGDRVRSGGRRLRPQPDLAPDAGVRGPRAASRWR